MWVLMYVFSYSVSPAATSDKAEWRLLPTVVFQEFSNEARCRAAKSTLEGSLKEDIQRYAPQAFAHKLPPHGNVLNRFSGALGRRMWIP